MTNSSNEPSPVPGVADSAGASPPGAEADRASRIAAELAALGEDEALDDELAFALAPGPDGLGHEDLRTVATLVELSQWEPPDTGLLPLERHRVWRSISQRAATVGPALVADPEEPAANASRGWRGVVAAIGLVAGLALVPRYDIAPPSPEAQEATAGVGEAARLALDTLGDKDGSRARSLADDYAARLQATRGGER